MVGEKKLGVLQVSAWKDHKAFWLPAGHFSICQLKPSLMRLTPRDASLWKAQRAIYHWSSRTGRRAEESGNGAFWANLRWTNRRGREALPVRVRAGPGSPSRIS